MDTTSDSRPSDEQPALEPANRPAQEPVADRMVVEAEARIAARRRGFWWGVTVIGGYFLFLVIVRLVWGAVAEWRLEARIAEYRAIGQPVRIEDFAAAEVADANNAALLYKQAASARPQGLVVVARDVLMFAWHREGWLLVQHLVPELLQRHSESLALIAEANVRPDINWDIRLTSPLMLTQLGSLADHRRLAGVMVLAGLNTHYHGDDQQAMQWFSDAMLYSERLIEKQLLSLPFLVSLAIQEKVCKAIEMQGATFALQRDSQARLAAEALLSQFLRSDIPEQYRQVIYIQRLIDLDFYEVMSRDPASMPGRYISMRAIRNPQVYVALIGPAALTKAEEHLRDLDRLAKIAFDESIDTPGMALRTGMAPWADNLSSVTVVNRVNQYAGFNWGGDLIAPLHTNAASVLATRRMAAIALALRMYELDHGKWPDRLAALVPEYLPCVPVDPFNPNQDSIRFLPDADQPRLYSIGENRIDDEGAFTVYENDWHDRRNSLDLVWFLTDARPHYLPDPQTYWGCLPKTINDDCQVEGAHTDDGEQSDEDQTQDAVPEEPQDSEE